MKEREMGRKGLRIGREGRGLGKAVERKGKR